MVRAGIRMLVATQRDMTVVGEAGDGAQAVDAVTAMRPGVVLMDIRMPELDGIEATRRIMAGGAGSVPGGHAHDLRPRRVRLRRPRRRRLRVPPQARPARGAPLRGAGGGRRRRTRVAGAHPQAGRPLRQQPPTGTASWTGSPQREREVLLLLVRGRSNAEIGGRAHVGESTVKTHVARVLAKLDLRDRVQAVIYGYETGMVTPGGNVSGLA